MDNTLERTLALSGIFQAAHMVQRISQGQSLPNDAFRSMIESLFSLDPETVDDVYPTPSTLSLGYTLLESAFHGSGAEPGRDTNLSGDLNVVPIRPLEQQHHKEQPLSTTYIRQAVRYVLAIMHLEQRMKKEPDKLSVMRSRLLQCRKQLDFVDSTTDPQIIQSLAQIYLDTAGTLKFRIQVQGQTSALKKVKMLIKYAPFYWPVYAQPFFGGNWVAVGGNCCLQGSALCNRSPNLKHCKYSTGCSPSKK